MSKHAPIPEGADLSAPAWDDRPLTELSIAEQEKFFATIEQDEHLDCSHTCEHHYAYMSDADLGITG